MKSNKTTGWAICWAIFGIFGLFISGSNSASAQTCSPIIEDQVFVCPGKKVSALHEFVYLKPNNNGAAQIYSAQILNDLFEDQLLLTLPSGWEPVASSTSNNGKVILVTAFKPSCNTDLTDESGRYCNWGKQVLFMAIHMEVDPTLDSDDQYQLLNFNQFFGYNSHVVGWQTWLHDKSFLFNGITKPEGQSLVDPRTQGTGYAYRINIDYGAHGLTGLQASLWGGSQINNNNCFVGRISAAFSTGSQTSCTYGQKVAFTRRCVDEPMGPENYSWYNTRNIDGTGGVCLQPGGKVGDPKAVPVFKNYVVTVDENCEPLDFDRNKPIRQPDYTGINRHMGWNAEWGDGQPTISPDGSAVAFWTKRSHPDSDPADNCSGFYSENGIDVGNGADRVRLCLLDANNKCSIVADSPAPINPWHKQGGAYFYQQPGKHTGLLNAEGDGTVFTDLVTGKKAQLFRGGWGGDQVNLGQ